MGRGVREIYQGMIAVVNDPDISGIFTTVAEAFADDDPIPPRRRKNPGREDLGSGHL
jgi:hypothetical protein